MKKYLKIIAMVMLPLMSLCIVACGDDDDSSSPIVGTWTDSNVTLKFNSDGSGYRFTDLSSFNLPSSKDEFNWSFKNNSLLTLHYAENSGMTVDSHTFFVIFDDKFTEMDLFYADDNDFFGTFTKNK